MKFRTTREVTLMATSEVPLLVVVVVVNMKRTQKLAKLIKNMTIQSTLIDDGGDKKADTC